MIDFSGNTFDTTNALSGMYLWLIFGYLSALLNCDLQRFLKSHTLITHMFGFVAFFFLFTLLDSNNKNSILVVWLKTLFIYALFVLMTKSKWYFVIPVLALLLIDQSIKKDIAFKRAAGQDVREAERWQKSITELITYAIITLIVIGTLHYMYLQRKEYKSNFSFYKFFLGWSKCKMKSPKY